MTNTVVLKFKKGTEAQNDAFTGNPGVITVDLTNNQFRIHDGVTLGGIKVVNQLMLVSIQTQFDQLSIEDITDLQTELNTKLDGSTVGTANGVATLGSTGRLTQSQLPSLAITEFLGEVSTENDMLLLVGERGDWSIRTDTSSVWILIADDASILANWREVGYPADPIQSVNGYTGVVVLNKTDLGLGDLDNFTTAEEADMGILETPLANDKFVTPLRTIQLLDFRDIIRSNGDVIFGEGSLLSALWDNWWDQESIIAYDGSGAVNEGGEVTPAFSQDGNTIAPQIATLSEAQKELYFPELLEESVTGFRSFNDSLNSSFSFSGFINFSNHVPDMTNEGLTIQFYLFVDSGSNVLGIQRLFSALTLDSFLSVTLSAHQLQISGGALATNVTISHDTSTLSKTQVKLVKIQIDFPNSMLRLFVDNVEVSSIAITRSVNEWPTSFTNKRSLHENNSQYFHTGNRTLGVSVYRYQLVRGIV